MIGLLNQHLAVIFDLFSQTKQAHWNMKGMQFISLHGLFDDLAESVLGYADMMAERATALGGLALVTARLVAANSWLSRSSRWR
jgi:starvation-inducible DNA-binding protein